MSTIPFVIRSVITPRGSSTCGHCHGTGQAGLGLMEWGDCDACEGVGHFKIDPTQKSMSVEEFLNHIKEKV